MTVSGGLAVHADANECMVLSLELLHASKLKEKGPVAANSSSMTALDDSEVLLSQARRDLNLDSAAPWQFREEYSHLGHAPRATLLARKRFSVLRQRRVTDFHSHLICSLDCDPAGSMVAVGGLWKEVGSPLLV